MPHNSGGVLWFQVERLCVCQSVVCLSIMYPNLSIFPFPDNVSFLWCHNVMGGRVLVRVDICCSCSRLGKGPVSVSSFYVLPFSLSILLYFSFTSSLQALLSLFSLSLGDDTK